MHGSQAKPRFNSFAEFWPFYVGAHRRFSCRVLHYIGVLVACGFAATAIATGQWWWLVGVPLSGYGFAWIGHFRAEHNQPATFSYPIYSFFADFKMFGLGLMGRMGREVRKHCPEGDS